MSHCIYVRCNLMKCTINWVSYTYACFFGSRCIVLTFTPYRTSSETGFTSIKTWFMMSLSLFTRCTNHHIKLTSRVCVISANKCQCFQSNQFPFLYRERVFPITYRKIASSRYSLGNLYFLCMAILIMGFTSGRAT